MKKAALRQIQGQLEQLCLAVVSRERATVSGEELEELIRRVIQEPREVAPHGAALEKAQKDLACQIAELGERLRGLEAGTGTWDTSPTPASAPVFVQTGPTVDPVEAMAQASGHNNQDAASILDMLREAGWAVLKVGR